MIRMSRTSMPSRIGLAVFVLMLLLLVGCAPEAPPETPTVEPMETSATIETGVPPTVPPTVAGPSPTPFPTNTPRPAATPTSAPSNKPNSIYVPGGEFILGSDTGNEDETPQQDSFIDAFNIDIYPVTNAEYREFVEASGHTPPRSWKEGTYPDGTADHPVTWVTWHDAQAYCEWAGKRLPTELEWEKSARGTEGRIYPWGDEFDSTKCNSKESGLGATSAVGSYPDGVSPYGVFDMAGNVWEWTGDWYEAYRGSLYELSRYGEQFKVLRGGSWFDGQDSVRAATRKSFDPNQGFSTIGFRCVE
jgi:formylglycine-generating enzyme required for sulfatase activity